MKLIHTSDLHLGISVLRENFIPIQERMVDRLCEIAEEAQGVIVAGDVFDRAVCSKEAVELYNKLATRLCIGMGKKLFIAAGNHDGAERLASCSMLLEQAGLYVRGRLSLPIEPIPFENVDIYILPYFNTEEARIQLGEPSALDMEGAMAAVLNTIRPRPGRKSILVGHCFVRGCATSESDRSAVVGGSSAVSATLFEKFDYVALGHLHKPQQVGENIRYSGTPIQYSFGEEGQDKHVVVLDTETMTQELVPVGAGRSFRSIVGPYSQILDEAADQESFVRVVLTDRQPPSGLREQLKKKYPHLLQMTSSFKPAGMEAQLSVEDVQRLEPNRILDGFLQEYAGRQASPEERQWFADAYTEALKGE